MRMRIAGAVVAMAGLAWGCASNGEPVDRGPVEGAGLADFAAEADGTQPGVVQDVMDDRFTIDPFEEAAGVATFEISDELPVVGADGEPIGRDALEPGTNVNVYFEEGPEGSPDRAIGVQVIERPLPLE